MSYQIELENIQKYYGAYHALRDVCLQIPKGQFVALVGPSGCGKSTLLRTIAGLEKITSGTMRIAGDAVNDKAPRERDLAMVFQSYALYPHMTVR
nr:ATP-binding cassette domain-containing protein [Pseudomonadota bacterium]